MKSLLLFFEFNSSIARGQAQGVLDRNMAQYERFLESGDFDRFYWFSYDARDHDLLEDLRKENPFWQHMHLLTPPGFIPKGTLGAAIYSVLGPLIHRRSFSQADIIKSHQVSGSWPGLIAKWIFRKPFLFRLGYPLSVRFQSEGKTLRAGFTRALERILMRNADHAGVTSEEMRKYYGAMSVKTPITLLPNYADVSGFRPIEHYDMSKPILFVGRLAPVKNLKNLITAVARLDHALHIYGGGSMEAELRAHARACGGDVEFKGWVANATLMRIHQDHCIYVLCSTREGLPKTLVEAMASGLICVGTPTGGILELIDDENTGYLTDGFDADAIEAKLRWVMESFDPEVGRKAVQFIHRTHSLEHAVELERSVLKQIAP